MNLILQTDSYKLTHAKMYPSNTRGVYSYLEAREGARDPYTVFFGLQTILRDIAGYHRVTRHLVDEAQELSDAHMGPGVFNRKGWDRIADVHHGRLPLRIKAVPEGTPVPVGNVLMTVENTDPELPWLTNALESKLLHVWYPTTVATTSRRIKEMYVRKLCDAGHLPDEVDAIVPFMLHDFGYRGATGDEAAALGGAAHLISFKGTDTLLGMQLARQHYGASLDALGFSVPATEHSVMTSQGRAGEQGLVSELLKAYPTGILSLVGDSYDIYAFTDMLSQQFKDEIMARDGKVVVRPDSGDPLTQVPRLLKQLWGHFGGTTNLKGYRILDPHVGLLWGDGLDGCGEIESIISAVMAAGFSPANLVFGMGGGLLQKVDRDTERFAFKCSAQLRNGVWLPISKDPIDQSKRSKAGRLELFHNEQWDTYDTRQEGDWFDNDETPILETVFENGEIVRTQTFNDIRKRAAL